MTIQVPITPGITGDGGSTVAIDLRKFDKWPIGTTQPGFYFASGISPGSATARDNTSGLEVGTTIVGNILTLTFPEPIPQGVTHHININLIFELA
jgi:hypothetical protein